MGNPTNLLLHDDPLWNSSCGASGLTRVHIWEFLGKDTELQPRAQDGTCFQDAQFKGCLGKWRVKEGDAMGGWRKAGFKKKQFLWEELHIHLCEMNGSQV